MCGLFQGSHPFHSFRGLLGWLGSMGGSLTDWRRGIFRQVMKVWGGVGLTVRGFL